MADDQTPPTPNPDAAAGAGEPQQAALGINILAQYVKDLSFENPNAPESLSQQAGAPAIDVGVSVGVNEKKDIDAAAYEVIVKLNASGKTDNGQKTAFVVELAYGGLFRLQNVPQNLLNLVLLVEAPRMLFPYARRILADAVRDGGFPPLMLDPIDFMALLEQQQAQGGPPPEGGAPGAGGQGGQGGGGETPNIILPS
ncbi:MAG: protein-export chaperone SecB [Pacificimonas sp.]|jgi:preprotein translocase subunit SecB|nr:protein-export chaperone SecB [Pacificimonas sp.]